MATLGKTTITDLNVLNNIKENNTSLVDKYTTLDTAQTISGKKTFSNGFNITGGCAENKSMLFFLGVDAAVNGGAVKYITAGDVASAIGAVSKNGDTISGKLTVTTNGISIGGTDNAESASLDFLRGTYNYISSPSGSNIGIQPDGLSKSSTTGYKFNATSFFPGVTNTYNLGTSTFQWKSVRGVILYENGTSLVDKYEPKKIWYNITPYKYQNNLVYHYYTKLATFKKGMNCIIRLRLFEDVNYASYGEYVIRMNYYSSYSECVTLSQASSSTRNLYLYVTSEVVNNETQHHVWIKSDLEWTSAIQFCIEEDFNNSNAVYTSNWEQILTEPSNLIYSMTNNGSCRIYPGEIVTTDADTAINQNHFTTNKFIKSGSDDNHVLLGGGGHKLISDFETSSYLKGLGASTNNIDDLGVADKLSFACYLNREDTNFPLTGNDGFILTAGLASNIGYKAQLALDDNGYNVAFRYNPNTEWQPWKKLSFEGHTHNYIPTSEKVNATGVTSTNFGTNGTYVPTMNFLSYWNGAYNSSGTSNLSYCKHGAFGTAATKNTSDVAGANTTTAVSIGGASAAGIYYVNGTSDILGQTDGALITHKYSDVWISQIYQDYRTGKIALRGKNNGTWSTWLKPSYEGHTHTFTGTAHKHSVTATGSVSSSVTDNKHSHTITPTGSVSTAITDSYSNGVLTITVSSSFSGNSVNTSSNATGITVSSSFSGNSVNTSEVTASGSVS